MMSIKRKEKGFTLIELMIVVAIIGILAAIAIPQFAKYREKAFNSSAQSDLRNGMTAEEAYYADTQSYFTKKLVGSANGARNTTLGINVSKNVTLSLSTATINSKDDYTGTARHSSGTHTYKVTGSIGIIR